VIRVLVCAASPLTRAGLESLITSGSDLQVVSRHEHIADVAHALDRVHPDVLVVAIEDDIEQANADLTMALSSLRIPTVAVITHKSDSAWAGELLRAGVRAILPIDVAADEMRAAVAAAANNLATIHADFLASVFSMAPLRSIDGTPAHLTARERDVLQMMADGVGNKTIAHRLGISMHTVKFHVGSIMAKLHATSRTEAVTLGIRRGLILL
jgi:two-component system, NarL family, response regulator YdfI